MPARKGRGDGSIIYACRKVEGVGHRQKFGKKGGETTKRELRDSHRRKFAIVYVIFTIQIKIWTYTLYIHYMN